MTRSEKKERAETTIKEMGLQDAMNTGIGGWNSKGLISGGPKRRVSICLEILRKPKLLFVDEPTSGLDSAASYHVIMKRIAELAKQDGRTVITSIHQPSSEVFDLFNNLCLLSCGRTVYFGPASVAKEFFMLNGFPCPTMRNPSDHFLRTINKDFDQDIEQGLTGKPTTAEEAIKLHHYAISQFCYNRLYVQEPPLMAASVAAVLRTGAHIFSGNSCSSQIRSARTFSVCLSSSSNRKEKRSGKGSMVALVPSIDHALPGKTTRRTLLMPLHSFQRSFRASSKVESATGPSTAADDTVSSSIPEVDYAASTVPSSSVPTMDSIRDAADADSCVSTVSSSAAPSAYSIRDAADTLDFRVGRILKAWRHPEAVSLYVEEVGIGEPEPRTICSGLVKYIPLDDLQEANVVVLANLKPRNMRGIKSNGMLLAASDSSHENVELLVPPEGSILGERIWFGSEDEKNNTAAASPNQIQKKKIWELVQPHLKTDDSCVGFLGVHPMRTSTGVVTCKSLQNGNIA